MAVRQLTCAACGVQFRSTGLRGRPSACCPECRPVRRVPSRAAVPTDCAHCGRLLQREQGRPGRPRLFCSPECRRSARQVAPSTSECPQCARSFLAAKGRRFCSRLCSRRSWERPHRTGETPRLKSLTCECAVCGKMYAPRKKDRDTACSRECGAIWSATKTAVRSNGARIWVSVKIRPKATRRAIRSQCLCCGVEIAGRLDVYAAGGACGAECLTALLIRRWHPGRRTRQARERAARVETVNPMRVFDRDGWRCRSCHRPTPKRLRGTYDDAAPELDHIEPISRGGEHSYRNAQLLCRACNIAKADGPGGQLLLFG